MSYIFAMYTVQSFKSTMKETTDQFFYKTYSIHYHYNVIKKGEHDILSLNLSK